MKYIYSLITLLLCCTIIVQSYAFSINYNDSLENILSNTKADTTKARILNMLAWSYKSTDTKKSWAYVKEALKLANKYNLVTEQGAAYNSIGALYYYVKNLDSALYNYQKAKILFQKCKKIKKVSRCLQNIAVVYNDKSDYKTAIEIYEKLLKTYLEDKDTSQAANIYNNIGNSYNLVGNYDKAMENFLKATEFYEIIGAKDNLSTTLYNLGALHFYKGSYNKAMEYCDQSLKIREEIKNPYGVAYSLLLKGVIYEAQGKNDQALEIYKNALKIDEELDDKQGIASLLLNISNLYVHIGNLKDAREYSLKAMKVIRETGIIKLQLSIYNNMGEIELKLNNYNAAIISFMHSSTLADSTGDLPELKDAYKGLALAYSSKGDYKNAYEFLQKHMNIKDTLFNAEKDKQITEIETKFQTEKKEKEILLLNKNKELQKVEIEKKEEQVKKQRLIIFGFIGGFILVLIFSVIILRLYGQKKKANRILAVKNGEILQKNEEITAQRDEIEAQRDQITKQHSIVTIQKEKIEVIHKEITDSIQYAKRIQKATLPKTETLKSHFADYFLIFKPRDIVSGDFYWTAEVENHLIVSVADCTGHGVPGAFMSMLGMSILKEIVVKEYITHPSLILKRMRKEIINSLQQKGEFGEQKDGMDMAIISIDLSTNILQFAGANNPLYIISNNELKEFKGDKMPIAIHEHMEPFTTQEFTLQKDDCLYLLSDGFEDQFGGPENKKFKAKPLKNLLLNICNLPMNEQSVIINTNLENWMGKEEQVDDITLLGIKI